MGKVVQYSPDVEYGGTGPKFCMMIGSTGGEDGGPRFVEPMIQNLGPVPSV